MNRMRFPQDAESDSEQTTLTKLTSLQAQLDDLRNRLGASSTKDVTDAPILGQLAREIIHSRRRRADLFGGDDLFGEPAWDILLELYAAGQGQQRLSISGACVVSGVPPTTALRWIEKLEREGWVGRTADPLDRRRFWVHLTDRASNVIRTYLEGLSSALVRAIT